MYVVQDISDSFFLSSVAALRLRRVPIQGSVGVATRKDCDMPPRFPCVDLITCD